MYEAARRTWGDQVISIMPCFWGLLRVMKKESRMSAWRRARRQVHDRIDNTTVRTGPPVGVGIGSLPMTPNKNGEIGVLCVESDLAGTGRHNKT